MQNVHPIVAQARTWLGTRFHHQGRLKANAEHKGGVDCLGLIVEVSRELGIIDKNGGLLASHDMTDYSWLPSGDALKSKLSELLSVVSTKDIKDGDIGLFTLDNNPQHVAIFASSNEGYTLIHAYAPSRKVVEVNFDDFWRMHLHAVFRPNEI